MFGGRRARSLASPPMPDTTPDLLLLFGAGMLLLVLASLRRGANRNPRPTRRNHGDPARPDAPGGAPDSAIAGQAKVST